MEKKTSQEKELLENINKRKMTFALVFVLIILSGFFLFNQLSGISSYLKNAAEKEKLVNVKKIYFNHVI
jgi:hypothetical protein